LEQLVVEVEEAQVQLDLHIVEQELQMEEMAAMEPTHILLGLP
jgi:hypothetical protein